MTDKEEAMNDPESLAMALATTIATGAGKNVDRLAETSV